MCCATDCLCRGAVYLPGLPLVRIGPEGLLARRGADVRSFKFCGFDAAAYLGDS